MKKTLAAGMLMACLALLATAGPAAAQYRAALSVKFAIDPSIGGTTYEGGNGVVGGSPLAVDSQSWTDTHSSTAPLFVGGVDFPLAGPVRSLINIEYGRVGADTVNIGTLGGLQLVGEFDAYQFWGLEGGVRIGGATGGYGVVTAGFRQVSAIDLTVAATNASNIGRVDFYDRSTVPSFGFGGGFMFGPVGFEVMAKYAGALDPAGSGNTSVLPASLAAAGERWSLPISIVIRF